jgi:hypothetical protein
MKKKYLQWPLLGCNFDCFRFFYLMQKEYKDCRGQVEEPREPQVAQESEQEALVQDQDQDERDGPQVLEEPEVREEAQREPQPAVEEDRQER